MKGEFEKWFNRAENDLADGKFNLKADKVNLAAFLFQQASEKALKALQIKKLGRFDRTHDLIELAKTVDAPENIIEATEKINPIYTISRYPDAEEAIEKDDAEHILELSQLVVEWVKKEMK